eukprot:TRINITY_DN17784_c0_g1_i4.p1 TRINITY_DN17784_c0_g1~~TRINITY_DN17784_c0_g1_i4.p1  ORF type:complete len:367 (+),score=157.44 TRINITY_DN17784_c0_g1_i4:131-1231(+)
MCIRDRMERVEQMVAKSAEETALMDSTCTQLRSSLSATSSRGNLVIQDIRQSLEQEAATRRRLLGEKADLEKDLKELSTALDGMRVDLEDNERISIEHARALGCTGMQGNHILRKELAALASKESIEEITKLEDQINAESDSILNSRKALEAKEQDKQEVEGMIAALNAKKAAAGTDADESSAIESEMECAQQRLRLVVTACAAITRCIEQHTQRIDKFNSQLIDVRREQQTVALPGAAMAATPREVVSSQVMELGENSSLNASTFVAQAGVEEVMPEPELSEEALADAKREQLQDSLESKKGMLNELEEWSEQLESKVARMEASEEPDADDISTLKDELESVKMKMTNYRKYVSDLEAQIQELGA